MWSTRITVIMRSCFVSLMPFSISVLAENAYEELVVTGSHLPIASSNLGGSYTVITKEDIKQKRAIFVKDLLRDVPGFAVSSSGSIGSNTQIRVRGAEANHLLVLIDGVEANDITASDGFDFAHLLTTDIERIEIIRGPQSSLYGNGALAGTINIITRKADKTEKISASQYGSIGSFNTFHGGGAVSVMSDIYSYELQGSHLNSTGINIAAQGNEKDQYDNTTLSFDLAVNPTDRFKFQFTGRHIKAENDIDDYDFLNGIVVDARNRKEQRAHLYFKGQTTINLLNDTWRHTLGVAVTEIENRDINSGNVTGEREGTKIDFNYQTNFRFYTHNFTRTSHVLSFGVQHKKELFKQLNQRQHSLETLGLIAGYHIGLAERFFLFVNLRYDKLSHFKDVTTYQTRISYKLDEWGTNFHTSYGIGAKHPTFTERFGAFPGFTSNPDLKPERSKSFDIGITQTFFGDRINLEAVYFYSQLEDEITGFFNPVNMTGISKRQGIELISSIEIIERLRLVTTYTWLDANEPDGRKEVRRPENIASVNLGYKTRDQRTQLNLNTKFTSKIIDNSLQRVTLGGYALVDLVISYNPVESINLYGKIENVFDKNYEDVFSYQTAGLGGTVGIELQF